MRHGDTLPVPAPVVLHAPRGARGGRGLVLRGEGIEVMLEDEAVEAGAKQPRTRRPTEGLHRGLGISRQPPLRSRHHFTFHFNNNIYIDDTAQSI